MEARTSRGSGADPATWRSPTAHRPSGELPRSGTAALSPGTDPVGWRAAQDYLARGWKLFLLPGDGTKTPAANCHECRDADADHDKEACACLLCHGFYAATADPARLAAMWSRVPDGVLALRTGAASGVVVVDAEGRPDQEGGTSGVDVLDDWEGWSGGAGGEGFALPPTLKARTPSGGVHLFYATGDDDIVRSASRVLPGVDVRGRGGYVALPPGAHGERSWLAGPVDPQAPGAAMLAWLRAARGGRARVWTDGPDGAGPNERRLREEWTGYDFDRLLREGAPQGVQDEFLNDLIFRMVRHGGVRDAEALFARVWPMVQAWDQDPTRPWTGFHVTKKIAHVLDTVEPAGALPTWTPRRESAEELVVRWDGAARFLPVEPTELARREAEQKATVERALGERGGKKLVADAIRGALPALTKPPVADDVLVDPITGVVLSAPPGTGVAGGAGDADGADGVVIPVDFGVNGSNGSSGANGAGGGGQGGAGGRLTGPGSGDGRVGYGGPTGDGVPGTEGMHDTGNANRLIRIHGQDMRWVEDEGVWMVWDGVRWKRDRTKVVEGWTNDVMTDIARYARQVGGEEGNTWIRHMRSSYSAGRRSAMLQNAQRVPGVTVTSEMLDTDPWALVVRNGVIDLRRGELREGRRADLHTRSADVAYDPAAQCPRWKAHVKMVTGGDPVMAAYLRRLAGYCLTGLTTEQAFFSLEGSGDNGKNAFIEPLMLLLGEYADPSDSKLIAGGDKTHAAIVATLVGLRLVFVDEIPAGRQMDVERVKTLTGSKKMKAQFMAKDWFSFAPQLKLWIAGNGPPPVKDTSDGIWRRMHRVVFAAKVPEEAKIKDYSRILFEEEGPGILNWALQGLAQWVATGRLDMPEEVAASVRELREESDHVGAFLADCVEVTGKIGTRRLLEASDTGAGFQVWEWEGDWVSNQALQAVYTAWCDGQGIRARERVNATHLGRRTSAMGAGRYRDRRDGAGVGRGADGLRLTVSAVQLWGSALGVGSDRGVGPG